MREQGLASARRTDQQDVSFLNFDFSASPTEFDPLVVLIDGDCQSLFGFVLSDHVLIKKVFDLTGLGKRWACCYRFRLLIVSDDLVADINTLVADVDSGTCNEFLHFILRLTTE